MKTSVWIASVDWDYRVDDDVATRPVRNDDTKLPISDVWFRLGHGDGYIGNAETERLRDIYEAQGIGFYGVFVPTVKNWSLQVANAQAALQRCRGLQFDAEPYNHYLGGEAGLDAWLNNVLIPLALRPGTKEISLCYDPRPQWLDGWAFPTAVSLVDSLAPMVYTGMFSGQGVWGDPVAAIDEAAGECPPGKVFRPIIQTYGISPQDTLRSFARTVHLGGKPQLFRRGVTPRETWDAIAAMESGDVHGVPYPVPPKEEEEMSSAEFQQAMGAVRDLQEATDSRLDQIEADVRALGQRIPAPTPTPRRTPSYVVKAGDTASGIADAHHISLQQLQDWNPGKPRSGNWNLIRPGERFRVG